MTRQVLVVIGAAFLSFGGIGIVIGLTWLTVRHAHGNLPYILDESAAPLLYLLPALLLGIAVVGAAFVAAALSAPTREEKAWRRPQWRNPQLLLFAAAQNRVTSRFGTRPKRSYQCLSRA